MNLDTKDSSGLTLSLLLPNNALALPMQELQMICHHPLLAFMDDFGIGARVQVLPTSHLFVFQPPQNLEEKKDGKRGAEVKNNKSVGTMYRPVSESQVYDLIKTLFNTTCN